MEARIIDSPRPGFFLVERPMVVRPRLLKDRWYVTCRIWLTCPIDLWTGYPLDRSRHLLAEIDGNPADPYDLWTKRIWPISYQEYVERNHYGDMSPPKEIA